jgi:hypothetical protein
MEVDFNTGATPVAGSGQPTSRTQSTSKTVTNEISFEQTTALDQALRKIPVVRPDQVAKATAMVANPNYPTDAELDRIANLFTLHLKS